MAFVSQVGTNEPEEAPNDDENPLEAEPGEQQLRKRGCKQEGAVGKCSEAKAIREFFAEEIKKKISLDKAAAERYVTAKGSNLSWKRIKTIVAREVAKIRKDEEKNL